MTTYTQKTMTFEDWFDKFEPMTNHLVTHVNTTVFETYGEESAYVYSIDPHFVWTEMDGDDGGVYIVEGRHFVNRICYYVTRLPWLEGESYDICLVPPETSCIECDEPLTEQESLEYDNYCERCYKAQGLGE